MKKLEFNSQICTTREQSQRLLDMGLKPETADMVYHFTGSSIEAIQWELQTKPPTLRGGFWTKKRIEGLARRGESGEEVFDRIWGKDVPAWSLSRLLKIQPISIMPTAEKHGNFYLEIRKFCDWIAGYEGVKTIIRPTPFEACISMIDWLIKNDGFNKDYLL